ncbi:hypothetical protein CYMTET_18329, partial [Cymbomonas tetramitiformis]
AEYSKVERAVWRLRPEDKEVAGYVHQLGNFSHVIVRGAGHIVPGDQPERALDMITRFIEGVKYENLPNPVSSMEQPIGMSANSRASVQL